MAQFSDKVAVVTGVVSEIEESVVLRFAAGGAAVVACGLDKDKLQTLFEKCVQVNGGKRNRVVTICGSVSEKKIRESAVDTAIENFGKLDVLVANPDLPGHGACIDTATEETFDSFVDGSVKSCFFLIKHALPHLEKSKGNVINMSTIAGSAVFNRVVILAMVKAAVDHMTRCLSLDLGSRGVRVNAVCPSFIPSRKTQALNVSEEYIEAAAQMVPLKRNGMPEDVAAAVVFLASEEASFITGQCLHVSGGREFTGNTLGNTS